MTKISIDITTLQAERAELNALLASPSAYADPSYAEKTKRLTEVESLIEKVTLREKLEKQLAEAQELAQGQDAELAEFAKQEIEDVTKQLEELENELFIS